MKRVILGIVAAVIVVAALFGVGGMAYRMGIAQGAGYAALTQPRGDVAPAPAEGVPNFGRGQGYAPGYAMPMQPGAQLAVGITYLVVALPILFFYKQPPTAVYTSNTAAVMLLTVISGYLIARRIRDYRIDALVAQLKLEHQARTDALTGIANRRAFLDAAHQELSRVNRRESPLTVLMLDIDHFKKVNDRFGHDVGDDLLAEFARRIEKGLRGYDQFARLGGEEFAVMLPGCNVEQAVATAERLRHAISAEPFAVRGNIVPMTVSIGVGIVREFEMTIDGVLTRADTALYAAKDNGRDRVEVVE
jgi:diguanylate cyclase (GGDEF)-like protein